ncbi:MAG: hypothetical protein KF729_35750 [Sandaracinaceae bacterium]|nr:hypothetical protein [Sandaracinaceae bacterium]
MRAAWALLLLGCGTSIVTTDGAVPATLDVVGSWHECSTSTTYRADGTAHVVDHRRGCEREGTWALDGEWLETQYEAGTCESPASPSRRRALRVAEGLVLVDPASGRARHLAGDETPRGLWRVEGVGPDEGRATIASVVGDPETTFGSGCYWSADGECGGLFSCSGSVVVWELSAERFSAATACSGGCPCGAVIEGGARDDGTLYGDYRGVNCERSYEGALVARRLP